MAMFEEAVLLMALAMVLAIGIERLMELMRAVEDHLEARYGQQVIWQQRAQRLRDRIEQRLELARGGDSVTFMQVLAVVCRYLSPAPPGATGLLVVSADQLRRMTISLRYKLIALLLGVLFATLFNLDLFALVNQSVHQEDGYAIVLPHWLGITLSGIAMGFGAGPVHKLIVALERARLTRR